MSGFPSLHLCIWMYGYLSPADLCSCMCSRVCTCESLLVWSYMKQCVCGYLWMCTVLPLACISGCVCMCVVLDLNVRSSVCNYAGNCLSASCLSQFFPQCLSQFFIIYLFVYCLPNWAACPMRAGPRAVVVTTGSPALPCTQ